MEVVYIGQAMTGLRAGAKDVKTFLIAAFERFNALAAQLHAQVPKITEKRALVNMYVKCYEGCV
jgi:hypothetical protein